MVSTGLQISRVQNELDSCTHAGSIFNVPSILSLGLRPKTLLQLFSCGWAGPADEASHPVHRMHDGTDNPKPRTLERTPAMVAPARHHIPGLHQPQPCGGEPA